MDHNYSKPNVSTINDATVIIVTFNSAHCLPELGHHLAACPHIILVDNGSDDGCVNAVGQHLPNAQIIALPNNLGFGAANNRALARVTTPFALLLNPDCELSTEQLTQLLAAADQFPEAAMLAPQLVDAKGHPERFIGMFADHGIGLLGRRLRTGHRLGLHFRDGRLGAFQSRSQTCAGFLGFLARVAGSGLEQLFRVVRQRPQIRQHPLAGELGLRLFEIFKMRFHVVPLLVLRRGQLPSLRAG